MKLPRSPVSRRRMFQMKLHQLRKPCLNAWRDLNLTAFPCEWQVGVAFDVPDKLSL